jgi:hypothetical protein
VFSEKELNSCMCNTKVCSSILILSLNVSKCSYMKKKKIAGVKVRLPWHHIFWQENHV